jgi:arsenate reductase
MKLAISLTLLGLVLIPYGVMAQTQNMTGERNAAPDHPEIVFVCQHGAALSVVSAAYFNKLAKEEHLNVHAVARGVTPQQDVSMIAAKGLRADGVLSETKRPQILSAEDASRALRIVAFCPVPSKYSKIAPIETWNDVPAPSDYAASRDAILSHLRELLRQLKADTNKR